MSSIKKAGADKDGYKAFMWSIPFSLLAIKREKDNLRELPGLALKKPANPDELLSGVEPQAGTNRAVLCQLKELHISKKSEENLYLFT